MRALQGMWTKAASLNPTGCLQVRFNVVRQLEHLRSHPAVREAEASGTLKLHGWVYDFVTGEISVLNSKTTEFLPFAATENAAAV